MKYGCATKIENYHLLSELGFDFIEVPGRAIHSMDESQFKSLCDIIMQGSVSCEAFNAYCPPEIVIAGPGFNIDSAKEYSKVSAIRANRLGVKNVTIGSPNSRNLPADYSREKAEAQLIDFIKVTADEFGKYGITVSLEALGKCYCNFINYLNEAVNICKKIGYDNVKVTLDYYNMEHSKEADIDISFALPYINHVHISDDAGSPSERYFLKDEKLSIHEKRLKTLKKLGYNGLISIEIDLPVERDLAKSNLEFMRKVLF